MQDERGPGGNKIILGGGEERERTKKKKLEKKLTLSRLPFFFYKPHPFKPLQWVFFVAPFAGAIAAAFSYELRFKPDYDGLIDLEGGSAAPAPAAPAVAAAK